ncbi:phage holin [Clostridium vitabionis]|uniref:phage holin n=1 Tax=Clostridium vitabionis TaxID=2784388 RepID=UPI00188B3D1F|nr:phage holin [Clostridium vitabionis]
MKNETYDRLKWIAQYFLPAAGVFYAAIAKIWNLPFGTEITGTIAAVDTFLGAVLGISSMNYKKGGGAA